MSLEENKAIVRRLLEKGLGEGDLQVFGETIAPDCPWGQGKGPEAFGNWAVGERTRSPDLHITIEDIIAEGDKVVSSQEVAGTATGQVDGAPPPTGKEWNIQVMWIFTITGGKISKIKTLQDSFTLFGQLGYIPTWEEMMEQAKAKQA
ncbi:MAG: ester cyclase [Planctomycetota bacterium]|jgi:predicted ester cyclase